MIGGNNVELEVLLSNSIFNHYDVLAGDSGLSREVHSVNIMDSPDIIQFLKPGELLLTNGYFMKDRPDVLLELIDDMIRLDCPGIAIKTKRFSLDIPQEVLDKANKFQFPILEISEIKHSLGEIFQQSTSLILDNRNYELQYALSIHKQFTSMVMKGEGVPQIVETLAQLVSSPVMLISHTLQILDSSHHFDHKNTHPFINQVLSSLQTPSAFKTPVSLCLFHPHLREYRHIELYPVFTSRLEGYLVLFSQNQSQSKLYTLAMEQAANVISMEIIKKQAVTERSRRYKNEFFSDLIDGFIRSEQEAIYHGRKYGLKPHVQSILIAAKIDDRPIGNTTSKFDEKLISERDVQYETIKHHFSVLPYSFTLFTKNDMFGIVLSNEEPDWDESRLLALLEGITEALYQNTRLRVSIGIGNPVFNVLDIGLSYTEAVRALQFGYQMNKRGFIQLYKSNDISYLLRLLPLDKLENFYEETFQSFAGLPESEKKELLRTLNVFYDNQTQLVETARQLFIHRNTLIYRLEKCEKRAGVNLKDPMVSLRFRVAFAVEPFLKVKADSNNRHSPEVLENTCIPV